MSYIAERTSVDYSSIRHKGTKERLKLLRSVSLFGDLEIAPVLLLCLPHDSRGSEIECIRNERAY